MADNKAMIKTKYDLSSSVLLQQNEFGRLRAAKNLQYK